MSPKPSKRLFDITGGRQNGIRESFLSQSLFSLMFKNIFLALLGGANAPSPPPYGSATDTLKTLPAFARRPCSDRSISPARRGPQRRTCCSGFAAVGQTDGQTDGHRPVHRPCSACYAGSADKKQAVDTTVAAS